MINGNARPMRLPPENYIGCRAYCVTVCCDHKERLFADLECGAWVLGQLARFAARHAFALVAYCAMPDHLHFLAVAQAPACDLSKCVSAFKQKTAFEYQRRWRRRLWQPRFYEHILREAEDLESVAVYIWNNPVRAGICERAVEYPLSGSMTVDWKTRYRHLGEWRPPWRGAEMPQG